MTASGFFGRYLVAAWRPEERAFVTEIRPSLFKIYVYRKIKFLYRFALICELNIELVSYTYKWRNIAL